MNNLYSLCINIQMDSLLVKVERERAIDERVQRYVLTPMLSQQLMDKYIPSGLIILFQIFLMLIYNNIYLKILAFQKLFRIGSKEEEELQGSVKICYVYCVGRRSSHLNAQTSLPVRISHAPPGGSLCYAMFKRCEDGKRNLHLKLIYLKLQMEAASLTSCFTLQNTMLMMQNSVHFFDIILLID